MAGGPPYPRPFTPEGAPSKLRLGGGFAGTLALILNCHRVGVYGLLSRNSFKPR